MSPITSTAVPTYVALDVPSGALFHALRVGQTARDLSLLALVVGAVAGLAAVNHRRVGAVRRSERRLDALVQQAHDVVVVLDADGRPAFVSSAVSRLLGYTPDEVSLELVPDEDRRCLDALIDEAHRRGSASATDIRVRDRREVCAWFDVDAVDLRAHPEIGGIVLTFHEVSERKALQDQLAARATRDPLTGLPNRTALGRRLQRLADGAHHGPFAVLFVDLDHFKPVNDTYGHDVGDEVLRVIAHRFERSVRTGDAETGDLVSRLGGDEFAIVLADTTPAMAEATARRLLQAAREPVTIGAVTVQVGATIGISVSDPGHGHPDAVLRDADQAMYRAKETGRDTFAVAP